MTMVLKRPTLVLNRNWQAINVAAFWGAAALSGAYDGRVVDASFHHTILGLNENVFVFVVLAILSAITLAVLQTTPRRHDTTVMA